MSRIQRILSKAEREQTSARLVWPVEADRADLVLRPSSWGGSSEPERETAPREPGAVALGARLDGRPVFGVKLHKLVVVGRDPSSHAAEQYRALRSRIAHLDGAVNRQVMAVTSPGRGDGRTVTALNLALAMAQEFERRTLLIDADLRHARVHTLLGIPREPGLVDTLVGDTSLADALVALPAQRLHVLPAGLAHTQPAELLASTAMRRLLDGLRRHFDRIVLDTPVAQTADTAALEAATDGVLVVVRAGRTTRPTLERALATLAADKFMGLVLNDSRGPGALAGA